MHIIKPEPWEPADATDYIRELGRNPDLSFMMTKHFKDMLSQRDLIMGDLFHLLKFGYVYELPINSTRKGVYKYAVQGPSPSSNRHIRAIVIPNLKETYFKLVTLMWVDDIRVESEEEHKNG